MNKNIETPEISEWDLVDEDPSSSPEESALSQDVIDALKPRINKYMPSLPHTRQQAFLWLSCREAFYGGSAGGGKTAALLMGALQYVETPGYAAVLLRRTFADLSKPGSLIPLSHEWLRPTDAKWNGERKEWRFPSGAILKFGYLEHEDDIYQYQGTEAQYWGFDELTQFSEDQYRYLFSRLRKRESIDVPLRMRSASNPGGIGHDWVKQRFITEGRANGRVFIPARLSDNPSLNREEYTRSLMELDPITRAQLLDGSWEARHAGGLFMREWFPITDSLPSDSTTATGVIPLRKLRYWDLAATEFKRGKDPDYTVGALLGVTREGRYYLLDIQRTRATPGGVEELIKKTAVRDGTSIPIWIEQEPGASGVSTIHHYVRTVLPGYAVKGDRHTGSKEERARPLSSQAEIGNIVILRGSWLSDFLDEVEGFPMGSHDDQVDAVSSAFSKLRPVGLRIW